MTAIVEGGPRRRGGYIPLVLLPFNEHSFAVHALKNARLQLIRRRTTHSTFIELVAVCPTRPIRNDRELAKAHRAIEGLMDKPKLSKDEADYLEVLGMLVVKYEAAIDPPQDVSHADMLALYMEAKGVSQAEVSRGTGISTTTISNVRAGRREFSRPDIRKLCGYFHCQAGAWL